MKIYCVVREKIKLISDCINHNIPLYIDLSKKSLINTNNQVSNIHLQKQAEILETEQDIFENTVKEF